MFTNYIYLIYIYEQDLACLIYLYNPDLALNNQQWFMCQKTKPMQIETNEANNVVSNTEKIMNDEANCVASEIRKVFCSLKYEEANHVVSKIQKASSF